MLSCICCAGCTVYLPRTLVIFFLSSFLLHVLVKLFPEGGVSVRKGCFSPLEAEDSAYELLRVLLKLANSPNGAEILGRDAKNVSQLVEFLKLPHFQRMPYSVSPLLLEPKPKTIWQLFTAICHLHAFCMLLGCAMLRPKTWNQMEDMDGSFFGNTVYQDWRNPGSLDHTHTHTTQSLPCVWGLAAVLAGPVLGAVPSVWLAFTFFSRAPHCIKSCPCAMSLCS